MDIQWIPIPTLRRLAQYHHYLRALAAHGRAVVSCTGIAMDLGLDQAQIRKDIEMCHVSGKPKVGYSVPQLIKGIEDVLGWNNATQAVLVGAGSLGTALLGYEGFSQNGLSIIAAFDIDPEKVDRKIHGKPVLPIDKLTNLVQRMRILIGIITTPAEIAPTAASLLIAGGVKAIWNFAPVALDVPEGVVVENVSLSSSLAVLSRRLKDATTLPTTPPPEEPPLESTN